VVPVCQEYQQYENSAHVQFEIKYPNNYLIISTN